jgi:hypothetical protein
MKKLFLSTVLFIAVLFLYAQLPITKTALIGKWQISSVNVANVYYYNIAKDSFVVLKKSVSNTPEIETIEIIHQNDMKKNITRSFIKDGKRNLMIFNANDSALIGFSIPEAFGTKYRLDESKGTLILEYKPTKTYPSLYPVEYIAGISKNNLLVLEMDTRDAGVKMSMEYEKVE